MGVSLPWSIAVGSDDTQYRGEDYEPARPGFGSQFSEFRVETEKRGVGLCWEHSKPKGPKEGRGEQERETYGEDRPEGVWFRVQGSGLRVQGLVRVTRAHPKRRKSENAKRTERRKGVRFRVWCQVEGFRFGNWG